MLLLINPRFCTCDASWNMIQRSETSCAADWYGGGRWWVRRSDISIKLVQKSNWKQKQVKFQRQNVSLDLCDLWKVTKYSFYHEDISNERWLFHSWKNWLDSAQTEAAWYQRGLVWINWPQRSAGSLQPSGAAGESHTSKNRNNYFTNTTETPNTFKQTKVGFINDWLKSDPLVLQAEMGTLWTLWSVRAVGVWRVCQILA